MAKKEQTEAIEHKMKPMLRLSEDDLAAIKDWQVGEEYKVEMTVKQVSMSMDDYGQENGSKINARFEVINVKAL